MQVSYIARVVRERGCKSNCEAFEQTEYSEHGKHAALDIYRDGVSI